ncbi:MAG: energy-coupling factor transporter ATPase [Erysipelotrichaceae bacterium]|nr:energy-coupling factor transporter ATPase [Erysipelotrichaceae bacterium]
MKDSIIRLENISYSYDNKNLALKNVSIDIKEKSKTVIVGHNGSGKSTIAKLICGLLNFSHGKLFLFGNEANNKNIDSLRQDIGIVFQNPDNQFVGATVRDDIAFGLENKCVPQKEMDSIINKFAKEVGMIEFLDKEPANLSGGQKQRVAVASILALDSKVVILDEATTMLDPAGKKEINDLVDKIKRENPDLTIISITHNVDEVLTADNIIVMNKGEVFYNGDLNGFINLDLNSINLKKPFIYEVNDKLKEKGIDIGNFKDESELISKLWQLHSNK